MNRLLLSSLSLAGAISAHAVIALALWPDQGAMGQGGTADMGQGGGISISIAAPAAPAPTTSAEPVEELVEAAPVDAAPTAAKMTEVAAIEPQIQADIPEEVQKPVAAEAPKTVQQPIPTPKRIVREKSPVSVPEPAPVVTPPEIVRVSELPPAPVHVASAPANSSKLGNGDATEQTGTGFAAAGSGGGIVAGNAHLASVKSQYAEILRGWVERHKQYPAAARMRRIEGRGVVEITIDRRGVVLAAVVIEPTGARLLDKELAALPHRASPFPEIPAELSSREMTFTVPLRFGS